MSEAELAEETLSFSPPPMEIPVWLPIKSKFHRSASHPIHSLRSSHPSHYPFPATCKHLHTSMPVLGVPGELLLSLQCPTLITTPKVGTSLLCAPTAFTHP